MNNEEDPRPGDEWPNLVSGGCSLNETKKGRSEWSKPSATRSVSADFKTSPTAQERLEKRHNDEAVIRQHCSKVIGAAATTAAAAEEW